ncbi:MAG TPA: E3 binding domain-containing protein, partial [Acidimicrobiia bacterium]|nr:E3 binding domain-containing protein [Acidimicrobiia bacterium]
MRRLITEHQLETVTIDGTGTAGRVTREDVLRVLETPPEHELVPLNRVQRLTGEHMLRSVHVAPHAFIAMEVDFERVD